VPPQFVTSVLTSMLVDSGCPLALLDADGLAAVGGVVDDGLAVVAGDRLVLTRRGRLLADTVVRALVPN